ncbi:hypothetical protein K458DRAFT_388841 [Lentithecium fluviatile CBS 122367]|uniref:Mid2 domain-containing protein n=1 Tax=Lentithecium fluviatile CBS 122367 TaxID=1168545 RepID=A0A6G1J1I9_9PLEO|nr:hypothetical protein K458DRAFT_388841 [Lentithecium fluviatile CBS 122367]
MRAPFFLARSALFSSLGLAKVFTATPAITDPTITPAPEIPIELLKKQNNDRFIGWMSYSGIWTSRTCDLGGTYFQSGDYWRCCATSLAGCDVPLGCVAGSLVYSISTTRTSGVTTGLTTGLITIDCTSIYTADPSFTVCNTGFMYENTADPDALTNIFCGVGSWNWSYYRVRPSETSSARSSTPTSTPTTPQSTPAQSTGPLVLPTPIISPEPQKSKSKAWIAGAVVGPIAGLALIGGLLYVFLRRKKTDLQAQSPMQQPQYPGSPTAPPAQYYESQKQPNTVPYGVASHNSWASPPPPQSPTSQGSTSPLPQHNLYGPPQGQQSWQTVQQNQQMYSPPQSPPPQQNMQAQNAQMYSPHRPFSAEMDAGTFQSVGEAEMPQRGQAQAPRYT